jgi:sec-independent protein translocase protein TatB
MLDVSFSELALIIVVAFLILGPKELPVVIRAVSRFMRQCREIIDECKAQLDVLAEESGVDEVKTTLNAHKRYIQDQAGAWQETYDISDILPEKEADEMAAAEIVSENAPETSPNPIAPKSAV